MNVMRNRALIVEDNEDIADMLGLIIKQADFEAKVITRAMDALPHLECSDVLFTDHNLKCPTLNGRQLAHQFKTINPTGFVVLTSGSEESIQTIDVDFSLRKPLDHRVIFKIARRAWRLINLHHVVSDLVATTEEQVERARSLREMNELLRRWSRELTT